MKVLGILFIALSICSTVYAQVSHERLGRWRDTEQVISPGIALSHTYSYLTGEDLHYFIIQPRIYYRLHNRFYIDSILPVWSKWNADQSVRPWGTSIGDPSITLGLQWKTNHSVTSLKITYQYPLGNWNEYQLRGNEFITGSGYHNVEVGASVSKILDPVILSAELSYGVGLPRKERFVQSVEPGIISLELGLIEALNDKIGYSIAVEQIFTLPTLYNGLYDKNDFEYSLNIAFAVLYYNDHWKLSALIQKNVSDIVSSPLTTVECDYDFELGVNP